MQRLLRWLSVAVSLALIAACGGPDFRPPEDAPAQWQATMRQEAPGGWVVWGYGSGGADQSLAAGRAQADSRARSDLAGRVDARLGHLRQGLVERLAGEGGKDLEKTDIKALVKRAGEIAVNAAGVERHQRDDQGAWHALARAELKPALREAASNRGLSPQARERLMTAADEILGAKESKGSKDGEGGE